MFRDIISILQEAAIASYKKIGNNKKKCVTRNNNKHVRPFWGSGLAMFFSLGYGRESQLMEYFMRKCERSVELSMVGGVNGYENKAK